jgi:hypothetical protein
MIIDGSTLHCALWQRLPVEVGHSVRALMLSKTNLEL